MTHELKPCPFCGNKSLVYNFMGDGGYITCACGAKMYCPDVPEKYVHIGDDVYRKIPARRGGELVVEQWNRRVSDGQT